MANPAPSGVAESAKEALLAESLLGEKLAGQLAGARASAAHAVPILRHLLRSDDTSIFSDEIVARVRGMFLDVARQLVIALAEAAGHAEPEDWAHEAADELAHSLADNPVFIEHFHSLALEWQCTERLAQRSGLDPVLPPLVQALMADPDPGISAAAMSLLAAQARFCQNQRRMQMPLGELPGDLLHIALVSMRVHVGAEHSADALALQAERALRSRVDNTRARLNQIDRMLDAIDHRASEALVLDSAGVALFLSALARGSGQSREVILLALSDRQMLPLALNLRASGLTPDAASAVLQTLHPDAVLPVDALDMAPEQAAALLAAAAVSG